MSVRDVLLWNYCRIVSQQPSNLNNDYCAKSTYCKIYQVALTQIIYQLV